MYQPHRQPPRPGSRPHQFPKGHYKLAPAPKHGARSSHARLFGRRLTVGQPIYTIDGDTIRMGPQRIRLRGIDAPELNEPGGPRRGSGWKSYSKKAPCASCRMGRTSIYGRTVADIFFNGRNVAEVLNAEGYARPGS